MDDHARTSGLVGDAPPTRYLWTDAFAVCNFLGLHRETGEARFLELALVLVDQVHHVLGRHRDDDERRGWISGLDDEEGERHPTAGGLRIGKDLPERRPDEAYDSRLEWERDGQYFHYLTRWMHALRQVARATGNPVFHDWAVELAQASVRGFFHGSPGSDDPPRMIWKASIALDRALVPSMGHHDPLDAYVTFLDLATSASRAGKPRLCDLGDELAAARALCHGRRWATEDALGIGGLLLDAYRLGVLVRRRSVAETELWHRLLRDAADSLRAFQQSRSLEAPATHRLAFRELGLAIGLHAVSRLRDLLEGDEESLRALRALDPWLPLAARIEDIWCDDDNRRARSWTEHRGINSVMLATSLCPGGFLDLG